ncbi:phage minor head protein [Sphingobacterium multivorum]|uniref:phage minor head protein n=1 Tax=Sphingobacterium multivorum TaxID=28454 RepID=UPI0031BAC661
MNPKTIHREFLQRQGVYERRYARLFLAVLKKQYKEAAAAYPSQYTVNPEDYRPVLIKLYTEVLPREAEQAWKDFVKPLASDRKDFFDTLMQILGITTPEGEWIRIWRDTAREWLNLNILTKIQDIAQTTQRAIAKVVEDKLNDPEGSSIAEISKSIEQAADGEVNQQRAVLIARTETMQAMNKGRRLSMMSSNLLWQKKWLDTPDKRTRLSHRLIATENYRNLEDPYWLINKNGQLEQGQYPGDPVLSAENVINCRCTEMYEVLRDEEGRPVRRNSPIPVESLAVNI